MALEARVWGVLEWVRCLRLRRLRSAECSGFRVRFRATGSLRPHQPKTFRVENFWGVTWGFRGLRGANARDLGGPITLSEPRSQAELTLIKPSLKSILGSRS